MTIDEQAQAEIGRVVQTTRIIIFGLSMGVLVFAVVVLSQGLPDPQAPWGMLTLISLFFALGAVMVRLVAPRLIVANTLAQIAEGKPPSGTGSARNAMAAETTAGKLAMVYQTKTIVACALLEGAAFFALIVQMIEHHIASLVVAVILLAALALHFPTVIGVTDWVERQLRLLDEYRHLSR